MTGDGVILIQSQDRSDGQANQRVLYFAPDSNHYRLLGQTRPRVRGRSGLYQVVFAKDHLLTAGYRDLATRDLEWMRDGSHQRPYTDWPSAHTLRRLKKPGAWLESRHPIFIAAADGKSGTELLRFDERTGTTSDLGSHPGVIYQVAIPVPGTDRRSFIRPLSFDDDDGVWLTLHSDSGSEVVGFSESGHKIGSASVPADTVGVGTHDGQLVTIRNDGSRPVQLGWTEL